MNPNRLALAAAVCAALSVSAVSAKERPGGNNENFHEHGGGFQNPPPPPVIDKNAPQNPGPGDFQNPPVNDPPPSPESDSNTGSQNSGSSDSTGSTGTDTPADNSTDGTSGTPLASGVAILKDPDGKTVGRVQFRTEGEKGPMLVGSAKFKLPDENLGWATKDDVKDSTLTAIFTHADGTDFASCDFDLTNLRLNKRRNVGAAQFKLDVRVRNGATTERLGACDMDLDTADYEPGIPAFQEGDMVTFTLDTTDVDVATGDMK